MVRWAAGSSLGAGSRAPPSGASARDVGGGCRAPPVRGAADSLFRPDVGLTSPSIAEPCPTVPWSDPIRWWKLTRRVLASGLSPESQLTGCTAVICAFACPGGPMGAFAHRNAKIGNEIECVAMRKEMANAVLQRGAWRRAGSDGEAGGGRSPAPRLSALSAAGGSIGWRRGGVRAGGAVGVDPVRRAREDRAGGYVDCPRLARTVDKVHEVLEPQHHRLALEDPPRARLAGSDGPVGACPQPPKNRMVAIARAATAMTMPAMSNRRARRGSRRVSSVANSRIMSETLPPRTYVRRFFIGLRPLRPRPRATTDNLKVLDRSTARGRPFHRLARAILGPVDLPMPIRNSRMRPSIDRIFPVTRSP